MIKSLIKKTALIGILAAGSYSALNVPENSCGIVRAPVEQPRDLQRCSYTRDTRSDQLGIQNRFDWNHATCWITAVGSDDIRRSGKAGTLEIQSIELWGYKNGETFLLQSSPISWCEHRARNGDWNESFWRDFAKWDDESCKGRTSFTLLSNEILHVGSESYDTSEFDEFQCVVTAKTTGDVRFDVGVDFREEGDSPAWPVIEGGFSDWNRCVTGGVIRVASPKKRLRWNNSSDCTTPSQRENETRDQKIEKNAE